MNDEKVFWMVYVDGKRAPAKKHMDHDEAFVEAKRLSSLEVKPVYVLKAVGGYKIIPNPTPVRFNIGPIREVTEQQRIGGIYTAPHDPNIRVTFK
jgi:hypothetical protein